MKKFLSMTLAAGALCMVMASCGGNGGNANEGDHNCSGDLKLESYSFDVILTSTDSVKPVIEGADKLRFLGEGVLPVVKEGCKMQALRDSLVKLAGVELDAKGTATPLPAEGFRLTQEEPDSTEACNYRINKLSISLITPRVAVWCDEASYYYCGAAHPLQTTNYVNFDRTTKRIISLSDLMKPDYQESLARMIRIRLKEMNVDLLSSLDEVGVPESFNITSDGVNFTYGLYSIAPYSAGEISVKFTVWELGDLLTPEGYTLIMGAKL